MAESPTPAVLDTSAVQALLNREPGADVVRDLLFDTGQTAVMSSVNLIELISLALRTTDDAAEARSIANDIHTIVDQLGITVIETLSPHAAIRAALLTVGRKNVALGDRVCLALTEQLQGRAVTADRAWTTIGEDESIAVQQIRGTHD